MRTSILFALATASLAACAADTSSSLTIHNNSSYALIEINVAPVDQTTWGQDLREAERDARAAQARYRASPTPEKSSLAFMAKWLAGK